MIVSCCDSRVSPEVIFDARPGELFVLRNVANLVPPYEPDNHYHGASAALEYAVMALKVRHIVVLGHAQWAGSPPSPTRSPIPTRRPCRKATSSAAGSSCSVQRWITSACRRARSIAPCRASGARGGQAGPAQPAHLPLDRDAGEAPLSPSARRLFRVMDGRLLAFDETRNVFSPVAPKSHTLALEAARFEFFARPRDFRPFGARAAI